MVSRFFTCFVCFLHVSCLSLEFLSRVHSDCSSENKLLHSSSFA